MADTEEPPAPAPAAAAAATAPLAPNASRPPEPNQEAASPPLPDWQKYAVLADASYTRAKPVEGYTIDPAFSDRNRTLYVDDKSGKAILAFRSTQLSDQHGHRWRDLGADALIALGLQDVSYRFRGARKATKQAIAKYGADNLVLTGHSLGGAQALYVHHRLYAKPETHAFNPGVSPIDVARSKGIFGPDHVRSLFNKVPRFGDNAHTYITRGDIVSALAPHLPGLRVHTIPLKGNKRNPHALRHFLP